MPCCFIAATWPGSARRASRPPWIFGWSVLTRPSSISGKPVCVATSITRTPSFSRSCAVPPVERISTPRAARPRANSTIPALSETLMSARLTFTARSRLDPQLLDLLAQGVAVDAEHRSRGALIALGLAEHRLDQGPLDVPQHHVVDLGRLLAVHVPEITLEGALDRVGELVILVHSIDRRSSRPPRAAPWGR